MSERPDGGAREDAHEDAQEDGDDPGRVLSVHLGHSANCSSVGSFVDLLFTSAIVGGAVVSAIAILVERRAAQRDEPPPPDDGEDRDASL